MTGIKEINGNKVYEERFQNNRIEYYIYHNSICCMTWVYLKCDRMKLVD